MKQHNSNGSHRYVPPALLTPGQTFLWFMGGIVGMFLVVSLIFTVKLGAEGRLPTLGQSAKAGTVAPPATQKASPNPAPVSPPVTAAAPAAPPAEQPVSPTLIRPDSNRTFESGTENLLPQEVAHLAQGTPTGATTAPATPQPASATATPPVSAPPVSAPAAPSPVAATPSSAPAPAMLPRAAASYAAPSPSTNASEDIRRAVNEWAAAWQSKNIDTYLRHYASDFTPAAGLAYSAWLQQRRDRLGRPGEITVQVSDLDIKADGSRATARFTQAYSAQGKTLRETKTLTLALRDGQWLIHQERIGQ
ncbi:nuclear transport factor 2 family protein [Zoogloea sp.]|uniref:YybH family protein n=1 Tax=Zoogloea sp. TaxID=49181 RepID=UPI0025F60696|nr:nuclear transport factor 2 family protein [Zoogloea sp.]MCK6394437.1 nuclear transport factor 2 family protein [Zoogloea sp.]